MDCNVLYNYLPESLVQQMLLWMYQDMLESVELIGKKGNNFLLKALASQLEPVIFLPLDYIIYKDDIGDEMYFLVEGIVHILSADHQAIAAKLGKGSFFGEMALLYESKRMCSVMAATFCFVYKLKTKDFNRILHDFPLVKADIEMLANKRKKQFHR